MNKTAFTMIELIFVIVVLGILAAVAIPMLSATRDDAKAVASMSNFQTAVKDIQSSVATQGTIPANLAIIITANSNLLVAGQVVTARVSGQNCAQARIVGQTLGVTLLSSANNCAIFVNLPVGNIPLDGQTIAF